MAEPFSQTLLERAAKLGEDITKAAGAGVVETRDAQAIHAQRAAVANLERLTKELMALVELARCVN